MENTEEPLRILVLDGGDLRAISQMIILEEIMNRVTWDQKEDVLPCDYFHSIAGVGAGGLLAIFLGVLGMTAAEALEEFVNIYKEILTPDVDLNPISRSSALETSLKALLERRDMLEGQTLVGMGRCRTFVCAVSTSDSTFCRKFRNYKHRGTPSNISIINAVRASWASPELFTSVLDGLSSTKEEFIGGDCAFANPTREAIKEAHDHFGPRRRIDHIISIGCGILRGMGSGAGQYFLDPQRVAIDLNDQLGGSGVYHRYGMPTFEGSLYTLSMTALDRIVSETKVYLHSVDKALDECILNLSEHISVTTRSLYQTQNTPLITATDLPPLSTYFVTRKDVMEAMDTAFFGLDEAAMKVMVVIGMGGCGKTQSVAKFMRVHKDIFSAILFIDANSIETIETNLIRKIRSFTSQIHVTTLSDASSVLCQPEGKLGRRWAIIYDSADDPNLDISRVIPKCDHGTVIITSRNQNLQTISPLACIKLDAMSDDDAVALLLKSALPHIRYPSITEREFARAIVEELGCLAIAVSQAGCHIQMQNGIERYLDRLKSNRSTILRRPMGMQREEGYRSVYAALDVTLPVLSPRAVDVLSTLSFLHPTALPLEVIFRAARDQFSIEPAELLPRSSDFWESIQGLVDIFMSSAIWNEEDVWALLNELQSYSLVTLVPLGTSVVLRFHNLVFAWARDRLSSAENQKYQSFAIRLLVCSTTEEDEDIFDLLFPHVQILAPLWKIAHVNDRVGFSNVIRHSGRAADLQLIWSGIHKEVTGCYGSEHLLTSEAALYLADAYWRNGEEEEASSLERKAVDFRTQSLGRNHPRTVDAIARQALGYYNQEELEMAESLQQEVLRFRQAHSEGDVKDIAHASEDLADTLILQSRFSEASKLLQQALEALINKFGEKHWRSRRLMERLQDQSLREAENDTDGESDIDETLEVDLRRSMQFFLGKDTTETSWASFVEKHMELQLIRPQHFADIASLALSHYTRAVEASFSALLRKLALDMRSKIDGSSATPFPDSGFWDEPASLDNSVIPQEDPLSDKQLIEIDNQIINLMKYEQRSTAVQLGIPMEGPSHRGVSGYTYPRDEDSQIIDNTDEPLRILVLDGGDLRAISQMIILEEIMERVAWDQKEDVLPCDYFHSIAGVGAGGLLAILLGVLGMTVREASEEFINIYKENLTPDVNLTPVSRSSAFEAYLKALLGRRDVLEGQTLVGMGRCRTFVCAVSASDSTSCCKFRNYKHRGTLSNISIIDAVRASWASPGPFTSAFDGPSNFREEFVGGDYVFANPTREAIKEAYDHFGPRRQVGHITSIGCGLPKGMGSGAGQYFSDPQRVALDLSDQLGESGVYHRYGIPSFEGAAYTLSMDAVDRIVGETKIYLRSIDKALDECIIDLSEHVYLTTESIYHTQNTSMVPPTDLPPLSTYFVTRNDVMEAMEAAFFGPEEAAMKVIVVIGMGGSGKTQSVAKFMRVHKDVFSPVLFVDASSIETIESSLVRKIQSFARQTPVKNLSDAFSVLCRSEGKLGRHWAIIYDSADDPNLDIPRVIPRCDHGTIIITSRNQNLRTISPLACVELDAMFIDDAVTLLLKSALPHVHHPSAVTKELARAIVEELGCLAIAVSQAGCHIQMQNSLERYLDRLKSNRSTILRRPMGMQREEGYRSVYAALDVTLPVLSPRAVDVLSTLSFLHPTALPLEIIVRAARGQFSIEPAELLPRSSDLSESIQGLCGIFMSNAAWNEGEVWTLLNELQSYSLVTLIPSGTSVVLRFHNLVFAWARDRLSPTENKKYQSFAIRLLVCCTTEEDEDMFDILSPHVQILAPLWQAAHANDRVGFSNVIRHSGRAADLKLIWNSIYKEATEVYGLDHFQTSEAALYLADACWRNGEEEEASSLESKAVDFRTQSLGRNHPRTIDAVARQALGYYNQEELETAESLQQEVLRFRQAHSEGDIKDIVHALEDLADTLILQSRFSEASKLLQQALEALIDKVGEKHWRSRKLMERLQDQSLRDVENDADGESDIDETLEVDLRRSMQFFLEKDTTETLWASFVEEHNGNSLSYADEEIIETDSETIDLIEDEQRSSAEQLGIPMERSSLQELSGHTSWVYTLAFSPDGTRIVSGSKDTTLRLWDSVTGASIARPMKGHTGKVNSVAFSPDGTRIVSCSYDKTLWLWDGVTGASIARPMKGHTGDVNSVAFSPDGTRVVSGSDDNTLRLWDGVTGASVSEPMKGHTDSIYRVAFSPDGTRIVSGSGDNTLWLWDGVTGANIAGPMKGHTSGVSNVAFSRDSTRIVSGSYDTTLRLWDGVTGTSIGSPMEGHTGWVRSVAFSPDGVHIVSGSDDNTLRLWNGMTGVRMGGPMTGHTGGVNSVAFSPDGTRVVSGSYDNTLQLWEGVTGVSIGRPMTGHTRGVNSAAFSPDGTRIVSGSYDNTLRLWSV